MSPRKDKSELKYEIMNEVLKDLVPSELIASEANFKTIFVIDRLLYLDSNSIDEFIKLGGSHLLAGMKNMQFSTDLYLFKLTGFDNLTVAQTYPLTTAEIKQSIGSITCSRICFNKAENEAAFVYEYIKSGTRTTLACCAIKVELIDGQWKIMSKVCIPNTTEIIWNQ